MPVPGSYFYLQSKRQQPSEPTSSSEVYPVTSVCDILSLSLVCSSRQQPLETTIRALPENPEGAATGIISSGEVCSVMSMCSSLEAALPAVPEAAVIGDNHQREGQPLGPPGSQFCFNPRGSSHCRLAPEVRYAL